MVCLSEVTPAAFSCFHQATLLPPTMIVERVSGESPPGYHHSPAWCLDKPDVRNALAAEFERRAARAA